MSLPLHPKLEEDLVFIINNIMTPNENKALYNKVLLKHKLGNTFDFYTINDNIKNDIYNFIKNYYIVD